jgi:hypothetical protein
VPHQHWLLMSPASVEEASGRGLGGHHRWRRPVTIVMSWGEGPASVDEGRGWRRASVSGTDNRVAAVSGDGKPGRAARRCWGRWRWCVRATVKAATDQNFEVWSGEECSKKRKGVVSESA